MREEGSLLGLLRTREIDFYRKRGWTVCGRHSYSVATPHGILCRFNDASPVVSRRIGGRKRHGLPVHVRYWRRVEQDALMRLYAEGARQAYGAFLRTEPGWHWIVGRQAYDQIYVALEGPPNSNLETTCAQIAGYAVVKTGRIVEWAVGAGGPNVGQRLLSRICSDAIEADLGELRLDAPPNHALHAIFQAAGGRHRGCTIDDGYAYMMHVASVPRLVSQLHSEFLGRVAADALTLPVELGLLVGETAYTLRITANQSSLVKGLQTDCSLRCRREQLIALLFGQIDVASAVARREMVASAPAAVELAARLLPELPLWYPAFDDLPC
jgi:hypothetical protein